MADELDTMESLAEEGRGGSALHTPPHVLLAKALTEEQMKAGVDALSSMYPDGQQAAPGTVGAELLVLLRAALEVKEGEGFDEEVHTVVLFSAAIPDLATKESSDAS